MQAPASRPIARVLDLVPPQSQELLDLDLEEARRRVSAEPEAMLGIHPSRWSDFAAVAPDEGCDLPPGPYPDDRAAVHT